MKLFRLALITSSLGAACNPSKVEEVVTSATSNSPSSPSPAASAVAAMPDIPLEALIPPADGQKSETGIVYRIERPGTTEEQPRQEDFVQLVHVAYSSEGKAFWNSHGKRRGLEVSKLIDGIQETVLGMRLGEKRRAWVPSALAYANRPTYVNYPRGDIMLDLELLRIVRAHEPPKSLKTPPPEAKKTKSGLAYLTLKPGTGSEHPKPTARVEVIFSAWTEDGERFESSLITEDRTLTVRLDKVVEGWREGLSRMVPGERTVFWIPGALANGEKDPNAHRAPFDPPLGQLVFDVELVKILTQDANAKPAKEP